MKLFTQMEEEAGRFTGETAGGSKDKVGGNQEIGDVGGVNFAGDSRVVAGWACVLEDGPSIGGEPDKTKDSSVQRGSGCSIVVQGQKGFVEGGYFGEVKGGGRRITDGNDGGGKESSGRDKIVVWGGRIGGRAEGANVDDGPLKFPAAAIFGHFVGRVGEDARDGARATPSNNVIGFPSGA